MKKAIKTIKFKIKYMIYLILCNTQMLLYRKKLDNPIPTAYLFGCPNHGNAGDIAIEKAEIRLLEQCGYKVKCIYVRSMIKGFSDAIRTIGTNDLVCVQGGGSFGGLYAQADIERLIIFKLFKKNKIISFPQTICITDSTIIKKYQKLLRKRTNIHLFVREKKSYEEAVRVFPFMEKRIILVPDIVLSLKGSISLQEMNRETVSLSLRKDKEKKIDETESKKLIDAIRETLGGDMVMIDTYKEIDGDMKKRDAVLENVLKTYSQSKVVITDRLHGMILAYITNTPCVAISNNNGKVRDEYETWLKECEQIEFLDEFSTQKTIRAIKRVTRANKQAEKTHAIEEGLYKIHQELSCSITNQRNGG